MVTCSRSSALHATSNSKEQQYTTTKEQKTSPTHPSHLQKRSKKGQKKVFYFKFIYFIPPLILLIMWLNPQQPAPREEEPERGLDIDRIIDQMFDMDNINEGDPQRGIAESFAIDQPIIHQNGNNTNPHNNNEVTLQEVKHTFDFTENGIFIKNLPPRNFDIPEKSTCPLCAYEIKTKKATLLSPCCNSAYCLKCFPNLRLMTTCPTCRHPFHEGNEMDESVTKKTIRVAGKLFKRNQDGTNELTHKGKEILGDVDIHILPEDL